jgi:hypothetical protein
MTGPIEDKDGLVLKLENIVEVRPGEEAELEPRSFRSFEMALLVSYGRLFHSSSGSQLEQPSWVEGNWVKKCWGDLSGTAVGSMVG